MRNKDYYALLGISQNADAEEIKRAYRRLAHRFHPDKNPGDRAAEEHFKAINEAYAILQDGEKRAAYDRIRLVQKDEISVRFDDWDFQPSSPWEDRLEGILEEFFAGRPFRASHSRGADHRMDLEVSLEEAAFGAIKELRILRTSICPLCKGSRCAPGTGYVLCPNCHGSGAFRVRQGFFIVDSACGRCQGRGEILGNPCPNCAGRGVLKIQRTIRVQIPAGVEDGMRLRLRGQGDVSRSGGPPGDLLLDITISRHPFFHREGNDLFCQVCISRQEARHGTEIHVPTLRGTLAIHIPAGTQSGRTLTLKGEGMPSLRGKERGDQRITILVS